MHFSDDVLNRLFGFASNNETATFKQNCNLTADAIPAIQQELSKIEQGFRDMGTKNDCETILTIAERMTRVLEGVNLLIYATQAAHTLHILTSPDHAEHRAGYKAGGTNVQFH